MNIGIDFDNTIAKYDSLFKEVAISEGFINDSWKGNGKTDLRDYLRKQPDGEITWMKLQGLIYGKFMHRAEIMPGVANFLMQCRLRKHTVFIVSHKTEFGHFDKEKISLREEAMKWMKAKRLFDPEYFGINKEKIFFSDTREEKAKKIVQLKCDFFIDDLPEVFEEACFPSGTKKILFGLFIRQKLPDDATVLDSWRKISEKILGITTNTDIFSWANHLTEHPIEKLGKISGRGNSRVYKVTTTTGNCYALKHYPEKIKDYRPRLKTEFSALQLMCEYNFTNVPKAVEKSDDLNLGLYEWIDGEKVSNPSADELKQAINFIEKLYSLSRKIDIEIDIASEACLSARDLISQIENRLLRLKCESKNLPELLIFLERTFEPIWTEAKDESISLWPLESRDSCLLKKKQILNPSDFGFHNSIKLNDGSLKFIDFDYFGWDDPVKLTADFIWHPAMNLNNDLKESWQQAMLELFNSDKCFEDRLNAAMPLYGLRWALIVLNEFLPGFTERRKEAGETQTYNPDKSREIQLKKAKHYCEKVKTMRTQATYAR